MSVETTKRPAADDFHTDPAKRSRFDQEGAEAGRNNEKELSTTGLGNSTGNGSGSNNTSPPPQQQQSPPVEPKAQTRYREQNHPSSTWSTRPPPSSSSNRDPLSRRDSRDLDRRSNHEYDGYRSREEYLPTDTYRPRYDSATSRDIQRDRETYSRQGLRKDIDTRSSTASGGSSPMMPKQNETQTRARASPKPAASTGVASMSSTSLPPPPPPPPVQQQDQTMDTDAQSPHDQLLKLFRDDLPALLTAHTTQSNASTKLATLQRNHTARSKFFDDTTRQLHEQELQKQELLVQQAKAQYASSVAPFGELLMRAFAKPKTEDFATKREVQELREQNARMLAWNKEREEQLLKLTVRNGELEKMVKDVSADVKAHDKRLRTLTAEDEALGVRVGKAEENITGLKTTEVTQAKEIAATRDEVEKTKHFWPRTIESTKTILRNELADARHEIEQDNVKWRGTVTKDLKKAEGDTAALQEASKIALGGLRYTVTQTFEKHKIVIEEMSEALRQLETKALAGEGTRSPTTGSITGVSQEVQGLRARLEKLEPVVEGLHGIEEVKARIERLQPACQGLHGVEELEIIKARLEKLEPALEGLQDIGEVKARLGKWEPVMVDRLQDVRHIKTRLEKIEPALNDVQNLKTRLTKMEPMVASVQDVEDIKTRFEKVEPLVNDVQDAQTRLEKMETEIASVQDIEEMKAKLEEMEPNLINLQDVVMNGIEIEGENIMSLMDRQEFIEVTLSKHDELLAGLKDAPSTRPETTPKNGSDRYEELVSRVDGLDNGLSMLRTGLNTVSATEGPSRGGLEPGELKIIERVRLLEEVLEEEKEQRRKDHVAAVNTHTDPAHLSERLLHSESVILRNAAFLNEVMEDMKRAFDAIEVVEKIASKQTPSTQEQTPHTNATAAAAAAAAAAVLDDTKVTLARLRHDFDQLHPDVRKLQNMFNAQTQQIHDLQQNVLVQGQGLRNLDSRYGMLNTTQLAGHILDQLSAKVLAAREPLIQDLQNAYQATQQAYQTTRMDVQGIRKAVDELAEKRAEGGNEGAVQPVEISQPPAPNPEAEAEAKARDDAIARKVEKHLLRELLPRIHKSRVELKEKVEASVTSKVEALEIETKAMIESINLTEGMINLTNEVREASKQASSATTRVTELENKLQRVKKHIDEYRMNQIKARVAAPATDGADATFKNPPPLPGSSKSTGRTKTAAAPTTPSSQNSSRTKATPRPAAAKPPSQSGSRPRASATPASSSPQSGKRTRASTASASVPDASNDLPDSMDGSNSSPKRARKATTTKKEESCVSPGDKARKKPGRPSIVSDDWRTFPAVLFQRKPVVTID